MTRDSAPRTVEVEAPAKVNLFLRVLGRRPDGYHDLETLVVPLKLADRVRVHARADRTASRTLSVSLEVTGEPELTRGVPVDETNLAVRAAHALARAAGVRGFAELAIDKRVPNAAGLGGGSADAAAVLRALNDLWGCGMGPEELSAVAAAVGSDVPALLAAAPALARGRGEVVEPANAAPRSWLLVTFSFGISTAEAFGWWDEDGAVTGPDPGPALAAAAAGDAAALGPLLANDLEAPVLRRRPVIAEARERLLAGGCAGAVLCGSGASMAGLLPPDAAFDPAEEAALARLGMVQRVRSLGSRSGRPGSAGPPRLERGSPGPKPGVAADWTRAQTPSP